MKFSSCRRKWRRFWRTALSQHCFLKGKTQDMVKSDWSGRTEENLLLGIPSNLYVAWMTTFKVFNSVANEFQQTQLLSASVTSEKKQPKNTPNFQSRPPLAYIIIHHCKMLHTFPSTLQHIPGTRLQCSGNFSLYFKRKKKKEKCTVFPRLYLESEVCVS